MIGSDFKDLCGGIGKNDRILFQTADGEFHEIFTAYRDIHGFVVLQECGAIEGK